MFQHRYKINLITMTDINNFVSAAAKAPGRIHLIDGNGFCVSGKSLLGAMATIDWEELYAESEHDIYSLIQPFIVGEST